MARTAIELITLEPPPQFHRKIRQFASTARWRLLRARSKKTLTSMLQIRRRLEGFFKGWAWQSHIRQQNRLEKPPQQLRHPKEFRTVGS